jgi:hypothetical protein
LTELAVFVDGATLDTIVLVGDVFHSALLAAAVRGVNRLPTA